MILQKDLKVYRFNNIRPDKKTPEKYQYQLLREGKLCADQFSDFEFFKAKVTDKPKGLEMQLISSPSEIDLKDMESENVFIIDVLDSDRNLIK